MTKGRRAAGFSALLAVGLLASLIALPAPGAPRKRPSASGTHFSQSVMIKRWFANPELAPEGVQQRLANLARAGSFAGAVASSAGEGYVPHLFNRDATGLPQNEESVTVCRKKPKVLLGGTNDYRGLLDPQGNFTGWHFSNDGGRTVANEGLLPPVQINGEAVESGGDPVMGADSNCNLYAVDLNYDLDSVPNGIGVYKTTPSRLASCPGGSAPSCWPNRRVAAVAPNDHRFLDKPWVYVGQSAGRTVVWIVYSDFFCPDVGCASGDYNHNQTKAVRCNASLSNCTAPILISGSQQSIQFGDVTIGPDGRTYVTWEQDNDLVTNFEPPERMKFWMRVAQPGSTNFGPARLVARERRNLGLAFLHANDFRVATYPKNEVAMVNGHPRVFVVWDGCKVRPLGGGVCEEPRIRLRYSDDFGRTWSKREILSAGGDNYFPTISWDHSGRKLAVAYFTNRHDPTFHNRQDVELVTVKPSTGRVTKRQRLTRMSNESEADPILGGAFIGDYIEVFAHRGVAYVHYNANYRHKKLLGEGVPIPQQDNFLRRAAL